MSIRPTTRLGYRYSVRPQKSPRKELIHKRDETNVEKILRSREPRRKTGTNIKAE